MRQAISECVKFECKVQPGETRMRVAPSIRHPVQWMLGKDGWQKPESMGGRDVVEHDGPESERKACNNLVGARCTVAMSLANIIDFLRDACFNVSRIKSYQWQLAASPRL
ncbi:hypothetical protein [Cupriavidus pauculus]|uniref:hypothetical protein n=1 Tax=Cupriavidus pauculus TaxID=82633 RepID=UPI002155E84D|nr:hypothetical protein [Cupriavidus pauculus]